MDKILISKLSENFLCKTLFSISSICLLFTLKIITSSSSSTSSPQQNLSLQIDCDYNIQSVSLWSSKELYTCTIHNELIVTQPNLQISQIHGHHLRNKENQNVHSFQVVDKILKFFPKDLESFFYRLAVITVENSKLSEIHQHDLTPFTNLKVLRLPSNDIKFLEKDLFVYNPKLEVIILDKNKIQNIHPDVFDHLDVLRYLSFDGNLCISETEEDRNGVKNLIENVKDKCGDFDFKKLQNDEKELKVLKNSSDFKISELRRENSVLKTLNFDSSQKLQNLTKFLDELKEKLDVKESNLTSVFLTVLLAVLTVLAVVIVGAIVLLVNQHRNNNSSTEDDERKIDSRGMKTPTLLYNCSVAENIYEDVRPGRNEPGKNIFVIFFTKFIDTFFLVYDRLNFF